MWVTSVSVRTESRLYGHSGLFTSACWVCSSLCHVWAAAAATISRNAHTPAHTYVAPPFHILIRTQPLGSGMCSQTCFSCYLSYIHMFFCTRTVKESDAHTCVWAIHAHTHTEKERGRERESGQCADQGQPFLNVYCSEQWDKRVGSLC